ncbi:NBEAL1 family protein [Megaselia abdita]
MDNKRDIYILWVQYTTKNEEKYFREFISRFVAIWNEQLNLTNISSDNTQWNDVKPDLGPHLGRLPDELLPAIGKFIIVARDKCERDELTSEEILETAVLIECLGIICRNFENISTIIKFEYNSNLFAILTKLFQKVITTEKTPPEIVEIFDKFALFLEFIYDPFLTWRNFNAGHFVNFHHLSYKPQQIHVEIVPFIYDCFQYDEIFNHPEIGTSLLSALGAIISGSQHNGMRAICPATVSVIIKLISKWECPQSIREPALKTFSLMLIVLQRSSPEERQIDFIAIIQLYCDAILDLLKSEHFKKDDSFEIAASDDNNFTIDVNALSHTISNVECFVREPNSRSDICHAILETNLLDILISMISEIRFWTIDHQTIAFNVVNVISQMTRSSKKMIDCLRNSQKLNLIFVNIENLGKPSIKVLEACYNFAFDDQSKTLVIPDALVPLIKWLPDIEEPNQLKVSEMILKGCTANYMCKQSSCEEEIIKIVCEALKSFEYLVEGCIQNLIKLIEELAKVSITPAELKGILSLLKEESKFPYTKQLLQTFTVVSLQNLNGGGTVCGQYFDVQKSYDGIIVPDIRNWIMSGSYGFIFHVFLRLNPLGEDWGDSGTVKTTKRRMLFNLKTSTDTGFEGFIQDNGNIVVAAVTRKEFLTTSVAAKTIFDGRWHFLTIALTPPKRPFSYSQINIYVDFIQKISTTLKMQALNEPFTFCTVGSAYQHHQRYHDHSSHSERIARGSSQESSPQQFRGIIPNILERTLSSHVSNYFTLPMRNTTSFDPNVKNFPIGMQDNVFGEPVCLRGQICSVLLAEPTTNIRTIFEAGTNFASMFSQDNDVADLTSRFVFCYSAGSCTNNICTDLVPGGKYIGSVSARHFKIVKIQDTLNSVGGVQAILPILHNLSKNADFTLTSDLSEEDLLVQKTPSVDELSDWEVLTTSSYTEWKMIQQPIASFLCLLRYLIHDHKINQENLMETETLAVIGMMLKKISTVHFDVNALMATHLLIESIQNQKPSANMKLLESFYLEVVFNFAIWSRMQFQIVLGHVQYISTMIKGDRKYFRKKFGVQYFLDVLRMYYGSPENINFEDAKTIRSTIFSIIKYYIQKDVNIKEVRSIVAFMASVKYEHVLIELLEVLTYHMKSKSCKDDLILLLHEPQAANLFYNFFIDKVHTDELQEANIRFFETLLSSTRVQGKYKQILRLMEEDSLYPGFFSYLTPMNLGESVLLRIYDQLLSSEVDYTGLMFLVYQVYQCDISVKLDVAKKLLQVTFLKQTAPQNIAKKVGWQESIARLLIKKPINAKPDVEKRKSFGINLDDVLLEDNNDFINQSDLINFVEEQVQASEDRQTDFSDSNLILNEIQLSVSEAANVIEREIKEVSDAVEEKIGSLYSVFRHQTSVIQDTFESLTHGSQADSETASSTRQRTASNSSNSSTETPTSGAKGNATPESMMSLSVDLDNEEQLVYLVSNILFTILWRGVPNEDPNCWKERGQVLACINLLALNNELITSHLLIRLRILEMGVQAALYDCSENGSNNLMNQENASQMLRMIYDLVVLGSNEDDSKKCSTKLLDGVLSLIDALMVFQHTALDDWSEMSRLCFGILLTCANHSNPAIVAMATAKLHVILQTRVSEEASEMAFLLYSVNKLMESSENLEQCSFLFPVMKALLDKCRHIFNFEGHLNDFPSIDVGPVFATEFKEYSKAKKWRNFIEKMIKPLHDNFQRETETTLWEPINRFWAECYEACKVSSVKRATFQSENRRLFQQKIVMPWKLRQVEEIARMNTLSINQKTRDNLIKKRWKTAKRFLYGPRGPWFTGSPLEESWALTKHENLARMRLKVEPQLYPNKHENAANLRDNTSSIVCDTKELSAEFNSIKPAVVRDFLTDDENQLLEEEIRLSMESQSQADVSMQKVLILQECELITLMSKVKGRIEVNHQMFSFVDLSPPKEDCEKCDFKFPLTKIREVHLRKYNLRRSALEVFLVDQTSYFLNFTTKTRNRIFTKILSLQPPNILYGSGRSPAELLRSSGVTQKWREREISNFEYLMYLNTIAGRSYNDLSQYPVFPWILADYTSEILDLTDPKSFRDLSKPVGVVNPKNEDEVRHKFDSFEDPSGDIPKFHYGTHYSNSGGVLHYLLRVEPFTSLHIDLQSGRFDVADRQFHSIPQTWKLLMDNPNDVKELIPEFFYFPEFLKNINRLDLGQLQITKEKVEDVVLPTWATTAEEFIAIHRRALESEYVSQNLHNWIDLIFGFKQKGPKAVEALNVFYYCSYEGAVDLDKIKNPVEREAVEGMINNFGQIPSQLLREPHPRRLSQEETVAKLLRFELKRPDLTQFLDRVVQINCELSNPKDPLVFLSVPRSPPRSFLQLSPDVLVSISKNAILGSNSWISYDKDKGFLLEVDATTNNLKNRKRVFGPFHPSMSLNSQMFAVSVEGKYLYCGGVWDNSLRVYNLHKGKVLASVTAHLDIITCVALDNCGSFMVTGSKDCTCIVWSLPGSQVSFNSSANNSYTPTPVTTLYGHDAPVSSVAIYTELDTVVSGSLDGTVNVYSIHNRQFIRTLKPLGCTESCVQISFVTLSYQGHIAFSALDDTSHSVHVYNINGTSLGSKYVSGRVTGLTTASEYLVVADDAGDITMSRLNGLKPVFDIPLHVPIQTVVVTSGNTHILAPLRDGRLAVIAVSVPNSNKKHSVLNV